MENEPKKPRAPRKKKVEEPAVEKDMKKALNQVSNGEITPAKYFKAVKASTKEETKERLENLKVTAEQMKRRFEITGQKAALEKLDGKIQLLQKEIELVEAGFNRYLLKSDLTNFVKNVKNDRVKFISLEEYERMIPGDVMDELLAAKPLFDKLYIVYTDYTEIKEKEVEKERKEKDPILLGALINPENNPSMVISGHIYERMYVIADWVDEFCDLTLDKLVDVYTEMNGESPLHKLEIPDKFVSADDLNKAIINMEQNRDNSITSQINDEDDE